MSQGLPAAGGVLQRSVTAPGNQPQPQSPEDDDRKVRRREKNRVAAQRSRKKQTQKADKLHEALFRVWGPAVTSTDTFRKQISSGEAYHRVVREHFRIMETFCLGQHSCLPLSKLIELHA
ncbi:basic leucine zipper transcriptional factor ATF-like 3 isoform X3 [Manis javanica]|uniref:basic leucine zipper transcriptional factor ATF-like 3 isoform X3 n=1 Tax=Manis javanica TaxID=9974 RepID=UPI003C6D1096